MSLTVRFWGVRGSVPAPGAHTAGVGGNTSCVELRCGDEIIILDAGTGLRGLGERLLASGRPVAASILFSHVHWDHIQGFPFFPPLFRPGTELSLHGLPESCSLETALTHQMTTPSFPVRLGAVPATLGFRDFELGRPFQVGSAVVRAARLNHPDGVIAYRVEVGGRVVVFATDTEHYPDRIDRELVSLAEGADVLIYDAQYTPEEYVGVIGGSRVGWGHSTWVEGVRVARAAGVGSLVLFHHDPSHDDGAVAAIERAARTVLPGAVAAREGLEIHLADGTASTRRAA
ncbi:MAG TPA: MBL fold metallo-hydrolase [Kofleriaceae bacterium]|nr:MBL fold metallo-hydrolase [Kofleriaceae bacterium]